MENNFAGFSDVGILLCEGKFKDIRMALTASGSRYFKCKIEIPASPREVPFCNADRTGQGELLG